MANNSDATLAEVMAVMPAPDFPTGGEVVAGSGLLDAYATGNGSLTLRGKARRMGTHPISRYVAAPPPVFSLYTGFEFRMWRK